MKLPCLAFVTPSGVHGGAERVLLTIACRLSEHGMRAVWYCMRPGPLAAEVAAAGIPVREYRQHRFRDVHHVLRGMLWLARQLREDGVDLIHATHGAHLYASPASRLTGVQELWHVHDFPYQFDLSEAICRRLPADFAVFTTREVRRGYPGHARHAHAVIEPLCLPEQVADGDITNLPEDLRHRRFILTVARMQPHKGHRVLLKAMPALAQALPDLQWVLAGGASDAAEAAYRDDLLLEAEKVGVRNRMYIRGRVGEVELGALYRYAVALVHPATTEGFGLTLLEAMAQGTPIVAADADGPRYLVGTSDAGIVVPRHDPAALADATIRLVTDDGLRMRLAENGKRFAKTRTVSAMVNQTVDVYRRMLGWTASSAKY